MHVYVWKKIVNMSIGWASDMIGWACAQPFPTLAMPLPQCARFLFNTYRGWSMLVLRGSSTFLYSKEGVTQGNPLSMFMYVIGNCMVQSTLLVWS